MEINLGVQRHPSSWLFVVKEMDGGSLCQPHAAAITPAAMIDGGEGKRGGGAEKRETRRGASITPFNLPVTARAWRREGRGWAEESRLYSDCWSKVYFSSLNLFSSFGADFIKPPDHSSWFPSAWWNLLSVKVCESVSDMLSIWQRAAEHISLS